MHFLYFVYLFRVFLCIITTLIVFVFNHTLALCEVLYLLLLELQLYNDCLQGCKKTPDTYMISGDGVYCDFYDFACDAASTNTSKCSASPVLLSISAEKT